MFHFFSHHKLIEGDYNLQQIQIEQQLGRGNSHVFTAIIKGQLFALKQIQIKDDYEYRNFLQQITFMKDLSIQSQCMVKYQGYFITKMQVDQYLKHKYAFIIMQCAQMNLEHLVAQYKQKSKRFTVEILSNFIQTVLNALCQLQAKHVAHCDIKPENILIMNSNNYQIKLCDVGSCKVVTGQNMQEATILGTVPFLAPELIKIKSKKIISSNPFKSDVFSFGLVFLYLITFKKFKSQQRIEVQEITYKQIIHQWIKEAREIVNFDIPICQVLIQALQFDQFKRPLFKQLRQLFLTEKKKKTLIHTKQFQDLQKQQQDKLYMGKGQQTASYYQSQPPNYINLFKSRKMEKSSIKTSNGNSFRITTNNMFKGGSKSSVRNFSPSSSLASPFLKKRSIASTSPDKYQNVPLFQIKKLLYINQKTKQSIGQFIQRSQQKTFVLQIPYVPFNSADTISIMSQCSLQVFYMFQNVTSNRLYLEYQNFQGIGLSKDAPVLRFQKIRMNLMKSSLVGGYSGLFRTVCNPNLQILELRLTQSQVQYSQIMELLDNLSQQCPKINTLLLCWQGNILNQDQHFQLTQKIAKLPLKKLYLIMNQNYIKYDKQMAWLLPKNCQTLYLQYGHNLLNFIINNLSLSLSATSNLKQLYLNFQNNNILKGEVNMIVKSIADLKQLQKIILDISFNKIDDLNYIQKNLSEHINLNVIQIRLHKTQTSIQRTIQFIKNLKQLFQFKLKILKVSINRVINIKWLKEQIQKFCVEKGVGRIICDVIGFDNAYFMVYLKKKPKTFSRGSKGSTSVRKDKIQSAIKFNNTISLAGTLNNFNPNSTKTIIDNTSSLKPLMGLCTRLYTTSDSYQNYMCVGCCQNKQTSKNTFYCKFCIQHCFHKGHNIVKVYSRTKCSCSHSGHCMSDVSQNICSDALKIQFKRKFDCLKCQNSYCISCIEVCKELHKSFVKENKEITFFTCAVKHKEVIQS